MTSLYEVLKRSKTAPQLAPNMYTTLLAQKINKGGSGGEAELSGVPPLTFRSNGTPLLDCLISGNTTQSGTPTPENPVMPEGTGERTGNLFDKAWFSNNTQLTPSTGRPIEYTGQIATQNPIDVSNIDTVTLTYSLGTSAAECFMYSIFSGGVLIERVAGKVSGDTIDVSNADELYIGLYIGGRNITTDNIQWIMLNSGSTALPYEPYGYKIPISSAGQTTPIYLGEAPTTRRIRKLVLTGEERDWVNAGAITATNAYQNATATTGYKREMFYCSHMVATTDSVSTTTHGYIGQRLTLCMDKTLGLDTVDKFKSYLAQQYANGSPVIIWYVLATETTGIVNEPLMRIGDYADTLSKAQAGVNIHTNNGSTTVDVDTTVKPSEVYIKYHTR